MTFTPYTTLNVCSAALIGGMGVVIALVKIPARAYNRYYRMARAFFCSAFFILSLLKFAEIVISKSADNSLTACVALVVAAFQAMCFTALILLFIMPQWVTRRRMLIQFASISLFSAALIACRVMFSNAVFHTVLIICSVAYVGLLVCCAVIYRKAYTRFKEEMYDYYQEEDLNRQLRWIGRTFFYSLAVGCLVFLSLSGSKLLDSVFILIYSAFYVFLTSSFINYGQYVSTVLRAVMHEEATPPEPIEVQSIVSEAPIMKPEAETPLKYYHISTGLRRWVEQKRYLLCDMAVKEVAQEIGTSARQLNDYFRDEMGEDFVKWRIRLRIRYACRLIDQDPMRPVSEVAAEAGFGDRSYFYRKFADIQGISVTEYRRAAQLNLSRQALAGSKTDTGQTAD